QPFPQLREGFGDRRRHAPLRSVPDRPVRLGRSPARPGAPASLGPPPPHRVQTKIGDPFSPTGVREDVRSIFTLGFFDDVQVRVEDFEGGVRLIFFVVEGPLGREVSFAGNKKIKTEELREKAAIRVGVLYNPVEVQRGQDAIREKYEEEGFFGVTISPRTERTPEGDIRI